MALFHFPILGAIRGASIVTHGYLFVDFFFVLSGFVIARKYADCLSGEDDGWRFIIKRFGRLWPLHAFMLAIFVLASALKGEINEDERHSYRAILTNLTLVHGLSVHNDLTWNGPSWSVSVEMMLYLLFAMLAPLQRRNVVFVGLIAAGLVVLAFQAPEGMGSTFDFGVFRGIAGFFTGALLTGAPIRRYGTIAELMTVVLVAAFVSFGQLLILAPFVFGLAVHVFAGEGGAVSRGLKVEPLKKLGEWSYSIYMTHAAFVAALWMFYPKLGLGRKAGDLLAGSWWLELSVAAGYLGVTVAASAVTYRLIEKPSREYFRDLADKLKGASATHPASGI